MSYNAINPYQTFYDSVGKVRSAGKITFYKNRTTTLAAIYSDEALTVAQTNPYTLDAFGRIRGDVKFTDVLTMKITNADLSDVRTDDDVASLKGSSIITTVATKAAAAALTLVSGDAGRKVFVTSDDGGEFTVRHNATPGTYADNGGAFCGTVFIPTGGDGTIGFKRDYDGDISALWFGVNTDGVTDSFSMMQAAHDTGFNVYYPFGHFITSATVQVSEGQKAYGAKGLRFSDNSLRTIIECTTATTAVFSQTLSVATGQEDGFSAKDITLISDIGIRLNDETVTISTGGASPFLMRSEFKRLSLIPITTGVGIGIIMSKCFDYIIEQCEFNNNARGLILQGCDIGKVVTNRFTSFTEYGILELSTGTFGSQNLIENNDLVKGADTSAIFIKSTSRHPRIIDNYLEQSSTNVVGFIDISSTGVPQYGANVVSSTRHSSVDVDRNRIDGHSLATGFIYRYEPGHSTRTKIIDGGTTGAAPSVPWLTVEGDGLVPKVTTTNLAKFDISGGRGNDGEEYYQFKSKSVQVTPKGVYFDAESLTGLNRGELNRGNAIDNVRLANGGITLLPALATTLFHCVLPEKNGNKNPWLKNSVEYNVKVHARTDTGAETLRVQTVVDAGGVDLVDTALTTQIQQITIGLTGVADTSTIGVGFSNRSGTPTNNIIIHGVSFEEVDITPLTDSSGGTANDTVAAISGSGADAAINDNFADLAAKINTILTSL